MTKISNIMIVDDNEMDHVNAKFVIEDYDDSVNIVSAYDGQQALDLLNQMTDAPELIFLDINMPGMDGHEFLAEYSKFSNPSAIIVMLTTSEQPKDKEKCEAYAFVKAYLSKPLESARFEDIVELITSK